MIVIDIKSTAKLADIPAYVNKALALVGEGNEVVLTGQGPVWMYDLHLSCVGRGDYF